MIFVSLIDFRCSFFSKSPSFDFMGDELISWYELTHTAEMMDGDGRLAAEIRSRQQHMKMTDDFSESRGEIIFLSFSVPIQLSARIHSIPCMAALLCLW